MLTAQLNQYLTRALERSPRALELCAALEGRRLKVEINGIPGALWVTVAKRSLQVAHAGGAAETAECAADVTVHGSPIGLLALAGGDASTVAARGGVGFSGDEMLAQQFQELARLLRPDLEHTLAGFVGRIPAHLASRALELVTNWGRAAGESVTRNTAEYLAHESRDLVPRGEAENFLGGVEALHSRLTAAETRVTQLLERLDRLAPRGSL